MKMEVGGVVMPMVPNPQTNLKQFILRTMLEQVHDTARRRVNPTEDDGSPRDPNDRYIGLGVVELTKLARKAFNRGVSVHEVVHVLYDLQKLDIVRFNTTTSSKRVKEVDRLGGVGRASGNGIPIRLRLSPKGAAMDPARVGVQLSIEEVGKAEERADDRAIAREMAAEGRLHRVQGLINGAIAAAEAQAALDANDTDALADAIVAHSEPDPQYAQAALNLAEQAVQSVNERLEGVVRRALPPVNAIVPYPLWQLGAKYPLLATALTAEARVAEAVRLLRMAGQDTVADMAMEELLKRTPLELEAVRFLNELVQLGLAEREEGAIDNTE